MAEITETETVVPAMRTVTLGALKVRVPPSPTMEYMFFIRQLVKKFQDGEATDDDIVDCFDQTVEFLGFYNKNLDETQLRKTCRVDELISFYSKAFGQADQDAEDDDEIPPPRQARSGTAGRRGSSPSKTRSRSST